MRKNGDTLNDYVFENNEPYRSLFENVHDGIYRSTPEGKIISANPSLVKMLGYESEDELRKLNIAKDLYYSDDERNRFIGQINESGKLNDVEIRLRRKDGSQITVLENSIAVYDKKGKLLFYEGTLKEITREKSTEEALKASESRYHTLIETLQDGLSLFDLGGKLIYCNTRKKKLLGYGEGDEIMSVNAFGMIHPDDRKKADNFFRSILKKGSIPVVEIRILRKDGSDFWAELSASLLLDREGKPAYIMDTMKDITERKRSEEQLMILKNSVENHYDGAYWMDTNNRIVYVNDAACRATGYSRNELTGCDISMINPLSTKEVMKLVWDKLRKDGSFTAEAVHRRKDGTLFPVEIVTSYINFEGKELGCGFARDISDRKTAAEEMRLRLEQMRQIIDLVPSYIFAKDIEGRFLLANKALAEVFGLSPQEIQGKSDSDYGATREQIKWYRKHDLDVIKKGKPVYIAEEQVLRKDGSLGWFQTVKIPYSHPGYEKPAILGVATDITERKQVEDELRKSESRFRNLFDQHSAVMLLVDPETEKIVDANQAASNYYGYSITNLRNMPVSDITRDSSEMRSQRIKKVIKHTKSTFETVHRLADGSLRDVEVFMGKVNVDNRDHLYSVIHDITEKKKILRDLIVAKERAEESDKVKTAFLHNISHEIRTPMNAIVGFSSLLESPGLPDDARKQYTDIIFQSSNHLLSIINDIVDISNIETGHIKISNNRVNVKNLVSGIYEQFRIIAAKHHLKFSVSTPENEPVIITDETKLVQIISNLLNNSFKFTKKGKVSLSYSIKGRILEFVVSDTGHGIKKGDLERIFERFYQSDNTTNKKTEGTGLGLSICRAYTELLGGAIRAESVYGKGSSFIFTIPYRKATKSKMVKRK